MGSRRCASICSSMVLSHICARRPGENRRWLKRMTSATLIGICLTEHAWF